MKRLSVICILLLSSFMLSAASDTAEFNISAYYMNPEVPAGESGLYIEIGDAINGGLLHGNTIDITNSIDSMLTDLSDINSSGHAHHEEIVFSYLIHDYDLSLPNGTDMEDEKRSDNYTLTVSMTPFALDGKDNPSQNEVIDSSFRLINTTYAFDNGSTRIDKVGICNDYYKGLFFDIDYGDHDIGTTLFMTADSEHKKTPETVSQSWYANYDTCPGHLGANTHDYEYQNHVGYSIRGAVSIVFDNDSYKDPDKANGLYSSTVTLTLTENG